MFSTITQYNVSPNSSAVAPFMRPVTSTTFNANAGTLRLTTTIVIGGGIIGGPSSITVTYSFTDLSFDRIRGTSMFGTATPQMLDMRRPAQPIGCKSPLPIRITQSPTPQPTPPTPFPTPPTPFPTPATRATPRPTPVQLVSSTTVTVPSSPSPATAASTVSVIVGQSTSTTEDGSGLPIGSETDVTSADDAPLSGSTIGLLAGGIAMLLIGIAVILFVLAKRRREKRQKTEGTDASGSAKSKSGAELKDRTYSSVSLVNSFVNGGDAVASGDSNGTVTSNYSNMPMKPKPDVANRPAAPLPPH